MLRIRTGRGLYSESEREMIVIRMHLRTAIIQIWAPKGAIPRMWVAVARRNHYHLSLPQSQGARTLLQLACTGLKWGAQRCLHSQNWRKKICRSTKILQMLACRKSQPKKQLVRLRQWNSHEISVTRRWMLTVITIWDQQRSAAQATRLASRGRAYHLVQARFITRAWIRSRRASHSTLCRKRNKFTRLSRHMPSLAPPRKTPLRAVLGSGCRMI